MSGATGSGSPSITRGRVGTLSFARDQGCYLVPRGGGSESKESAWKRVVCARVGRPRQLLVSSVIVENQERGLSLVICSSSVTNFSSMGHLV